MGDSYNFTCLHEFVSVTFSKITKNGKIPNYYVMLDALYTQTLITNFEPKYSSSKHIYNSVVVAGRLLQAILICSILFYDILFILSYFRIRIDNLSIKFALKWVNAQ